jgi:glycerol-1-phosphate dehydrogenase [NAD(P)+]
MSASLHPRTALAEALAAARETRALALGTGVIAETGTLFARYFPGTPAVVVADPDTSALAGEAVRTALDRAGVRQEQPYLFTERTPPAKLVVAERLAQVLRGHAAVPVAVGSGTINDLVKLASHRTGRESYLCVATAASMDGYTAYGASLTAAGAKQTFPCPAPRVVVADLAVIGRAPPERTAAGYADLLAKVTAGADWMLADALGVEAIEPRAWGIVQGGLREALADPAGARAGEPGPLGRLVEGLMLGGLAMQSAQTSRPASGAEHQFSHLWDMEGHTHRGEAPSHGFKVGVATVAVARLYEALLAIDLERLDPAAAARAWAEGGQPDEATLRALFADTGFVETAVTETRAKAASAAEVRAQLVRLRAAWPDLRARLQAQLLPAGELQRRLRLAGAPVEPEEIGLSRARLRASFRRAGLIRRRFTVLDVALRTGLLEPLLENLFGAGGPWDLRTPATP